jgi:hypothetical protein
MQNYELETENFTSHKLEVAIQRSMTVTGPPPQIPQTPTNEAL